MKIIEVQEKKNSTNNVQIRVYTHRGGIPLPWRGCLRQIAWHIPSGCVELKVSKTLGIQVVDPATVAEELKKIRPDIDIKL